VSVLQIQIIRKETARRRRRRNIFFRVNAFLNMLQLEFNRLLSICL